MLMTNPTGLWLAALIRSRQAEMANAAAATAHRDFPLYRAVPLPEVAAVFAIAYQVLAESLEIGDLLPVHSYIRQVGTARLRGGATPADLVALGEVLLAQVRAVIEAARHADPGRVEGALRLWEPIERSIRRILIDLPHEQPPPA
jgi:hypothetical protein